MEDEAAIIEKLLDVRIAVDVAEDTLLEWLKELWTLVEDGERDETKRRIKALIDNLESDSPDDSEE